MKKFLVPVLIASFMLLFISTSMAQSVEQHVKYAPNSKGDLMIFPYYIGIPGFENKISVTNTSLTNSTVAKVVFRSQKFSEELLDFFVYLSPADKWEGTIYHDGSTVRVKSCDDSVLVPSGNFANATNCIDQPLYAPSCDNDSMMFGYVEVIEARSFDAGSRPVPKSDVKSDYEGYGAPDIYQTANILTGKIEIAVPSLNLSAMMRAEVFADWDNREELTIASPDGLGATLSFNTLCELEAAISKDNIAMNYINDGEQFTAHWFNYPTKDSEWDAECDYFDSKESCFFTSTSGKDGCVNFEAYAFDMMENKSGESVFSGGSDQNKHCDEVNLDLIANKQPFEKGWVLYNFTDDGPTTFTPQTSVCSSDATYTGVPVLPSMMYLGANGLSMTKAAYDDGSISVGGTKYENYQYSDFNCTDPDPTPRD